jgi:hypothetical protein
MHMRNPRPWLAGIIIGHCIANVALTAQTPTDQTPATPATELIEWSRARKLRRADFKDWGTVQTGLGARSAIEIQASWACAEDRLDAKIRAVFDPQKSTWPTGMRSGFDSLLLEHEQTHFDIAELVARKIRSHFAELTDVCTRRGGTIPLAAIVEDYQRELNDEQARYDRQTAFGTDARMQWTWTSRIRKALEGR